MLNKFFNFLKGYVIIEVTGKNAERFINICLRRGIELDALSYRDNGIRTRVSRTDFKRLRGVRKKCGVNIKIVKKCGGKAFLTRHRHRYMFLIFAAVCAAFIYISSGFIWAVEINGVKDTDISYLAKILNRNGVFVGGRKSKISELYDIKDDVINHTDDIAWVWVYIEGAKARVEVLEKRRPPRVIPRAEPCDIVALSDGVVKKITVKNGDAVTDEGGAVSKGDVLISGKVKAYKEGEEERYMYVHSIGEVRAYTIHSSAVVSPLYREIRTPAGGNKKYYTLELFGKKYELYKEKNIEFSDYDVKTKCYELKLPLFGFTGIALTVEDNIDVEVSKREISENTALELAKMTAEEKIAKELLPRAELLDTDIEYEKINEENIRVKVVMSFIESIGEESTLRSEEIDQQTDRDTRES